MRFPERRKRVMARSIALGHCICNPKQPCPCELLIKQDLCPCAGERPDPTKEAVRLTERARKPGCASKISHVDLQRVLSRLPMFDDPNVLVGVAAGDDAGIYRIDGDIHLVQTVDVFSPVVDDPFTFGQICAANSISDIYAMGGRPLCALSIIGFPIEELPHEVMSEILRGGVETLHNAGVSVIGGHSLNNEEIQCGFAVTGIIRKNGIVSNAGAQLGDALVLTKPLGTGLISFAQQIGRASNEAVELISRSMATLNKDAAELMLEFGAHACTDVTGFSLLGHLSEMARHSGVSAQVDLAKVPVFAEALACVQEDIIPGAVERNIEAFQEGILTLDNDDGNLISLLYDAQTSGGLLVVLPQNQADAYMEAMRRRGHSWTARIGMIQPKQSFFVQVITNIPENLVGTNLLKPAAISLSKVDTKTYAPALSCCGDGIAGSEKSLMSNSSQNSSTNSVSSSKFNMDNPNSTAEAFTQFMKAANSPDLLDAKTKRLLAIALSLAQKCDPCMKIHIQTALSQGITRGEIDEAAWLAIAFCGAPAKMFYEGIWKELEK